MYKTSQERIQDKEDAILICRKILANPYYVLDTETTGLAKEGGQICQIGILESNGNRFKSFVKATIPISNEANKVNHILDFYLRDAPDILMILEKIPPHINMVAYNVDFELTALENSITAKGGTFSRYDLGKAFDAMKIFSAFYGVWHDWFNDYKWQKLVHACWLCGIELDLPAHDAMSDAIMTDEIIKYIASQKLSTE